MGMEQGKDGNNLLNKREQAARWVQHFCQVLNCPEPEHLTCSKTTKLQQLARYHIAIHTIQGLLSSLTG